MRFIIGALAMAAVWAGFTLDQRRRRQSQELQGEVSRWEGEGGVIGPNEVSP